MLQRAGFGSAKAVATLDGWLAGFSLQDFEGIVNDDGSGGVDGDNSGGGDDSDDDAAETTATMTTWMSTHTVAVAPAHDMSKAEALVSGATIFYSSLSTRKSSLSQTEVKEQRAVVLPLLQRTSPLVLLRRSLVGQ